MKVGIEEDLGKKASLLNECGNDKWQLLAFYCITSKNGHAHFKCFAANAAILLKCVLPFLDVMYESVDSLSANPTKWLNRLKQFARNLQANCLNVFDHFVGLALKG